MRASDRLAEFTRDALNAGHSRERIAEMLLDAGWTRPEINSALDSWAEIRSIPPVPRPRAHVSPREALFYGLLFIALLVTTWHLVALGHALVDRMLPALDEQFHHEWSRSRMRWSAAALIVFAPLLVALNRRAQHMAAADPGKRRSAMREWLGHGAIFFAVLALLGDLLAVIHAALGGDLSLRFILKALIVAFVAGGVLMYYRAELAEADRKSVV